MKKVVCSILVVVLAISLVVFFNGFTTKADAATEIEIYRATNTYDEDTIEKNKNVAGYKRNQYIITYDMDNKKTDRLVAENPTVTVFTHGYNSSSKDWLNNAKDAETKEQFIFQYSSESMIDKVIWLYGGIEKVVLLKVEMTSYEEYNLSRIALKIENGEIVDKFSTLVNPSKWRTKYFFKK